jgi:hypothetical protein
VTFQTGIEKGENFSRTGRKVSKDFIYTLEQLIAGGIRPKHVEDVAELLVKRVTELLDNAKDMHEYFGTVQTELEKVCEASRLSTLI